MIRFFKTDSSNTGRTWHHTSMLVVMCVLFCCFFPSAVCAKKPERMYHLKLHLTRESIQLIDSKLLPGRAKIRKGKDRPVEGKRLLYEVLGENDQVLCTLSKDYPLYMYVERDPARDEAQENIRELPSLDITIKIPYQKDYQSIRFYYVNGGSDQADADERVFLGKFPLSGTAVEEDN